MKTKPYSPYSPQSLKTIQNWFGSIISRPIDENNRIQPFAPSGKSIVDEAAEYIAASPTLKPYERMQIYNQQYWWRLLNVLHDNFPFLTRLFGYQDFNQEIGFPYLSKYPPNHWSLNVLGDRLPRWISEEYTLPDQQLVYNVAILDSAFCVSFSIPSFAPLDPSKILSEGGTDQLLSTTLYLQPYIFLFQWNYNLLDFREQFLKESVEFWLNNDFPPILQDRTYSFILHRDQHNTLYWKEISTAEYFLMTIFQSGATIETACERLERENPSLCQEATDHLQLWFQDWASSGWLTTEK